MSPTPKKLFVAWLILLSTGLLWGARYATQAGQHTMSDLKDKGTGRPVFLVFVHPKCSCSKATITELSKLMPSLEGVSVKIIFNQYAKDEDWVRGELWQQALKIEGAEMISDFGGKITAEYGVKTSGHSFLFDENGKQIFSGGLTIARGHEGASAGAEFLKQWKKQQKKETFFERVFGCEHFGGSFES